jgi:membrane protease YdiL (CAAX protease family)
MVQQQMRFNYWSQLAILLGLVGVGFIISSFITIAIGLKAMGGDMAAAMKNPEAIQAALLNPANAGYAQTAQIAGTFFMMFLPSFAFVLICHKKLLWAGFSKHFNVAQVLIGFLIMFTANYLAGPFEDITKKILVHLPSIDKSAKAAEDLYTRAVASMSNLKGMGQFIIAVFVIAFFPAVFEEMLFRGVLQNFLTKWLKKPAVAIVIASLLFSFIHASYYLFISRFILGYALGLMFYYTKNIWVNIFAHFINNLIALTVLFFTNMQDKAAVVNQPEFKLPIWSVFITGSILFGLFTLLIKVSKENRNRIALKESLAFSNEPLIAQQ